MFWLVRQKKHQAKCFWSRICQSEQLRSSWSSCKDNRKTKKSELFCLTCNAGMRRLEIWEGLSWFQEARSASSSFCGLRRLRRWECGLHGLVCAHSASGLPSNGAEQLARSAAVPAVGTRCSVHETVSETRNRKRCRREARRKGCCGRCRGGRLRSLLGVCEESFVCHDRRGFAKASGNKRSSKCPNRVQKRPFAWIRIYRVCFQRGCCESHETGLKERQQSRRK